MSPLPSPPAGEPPRIFTLDQCAPKFGEAVTAVLAGMAERGHAARVFESLRSNERQRYLYGFGREYDDRVPRGSVTAASRADEGWHYYGLAADIVEDDATPWRASNAFWQDLGLLAGAHGLTWGGRWTRVDLPHVQWGRCKRSPTDLSRTLHAQGGNPLVWRRVGAA